MSSKVLGILLVILLLSQAHPASAQARNPCDLLRTALSDSPYWEILGPLFQDPSGYCYAHVNAPRQGVEIAMFVRQLGGSVSAQRWVKETGRGSPVELGDYGEYKFSDGSVLFAIGSWGIAIAWGALDARGNAVATTPSNEAVMATVAVDLQNRLRRELGVPQPRTLSPGAPASTEWVYVRKVFDSDKILIQRQNGESYILEYGVGCIALWRYEGRWAMVYSPYSFAGVGSRILLPNDNGDCRIWNSELL